MRTFLSFATAISGIAAAVIVIGQIAACENTRQKTENELIKSMTDKGWCLDRWSYSWKPCTAPQPTPAERKD